jgi:hypothetical protein
MTENQGRVIRYTCKLFNLFDVEHDIEREA